MVVVKCDLFRNFTVNEISTAKCGMFYLQEALNDPDFHAAILQTRFVGTKDTSVTILEKLLSGADRYDSTKDNTLNFQLVMYSKWWSRVIGYVLDGDRTVYINRKYYGGTGGAMNMASNLLHEYMHLLSYSHSSARDFGSVPYKVNTLFESWCISKGYDK